LISMWWRWWWVKKNSKLRIKPSPLYWALSFPSLILDRNWQRGIAEGIFLRLKYSQNLHSGGVRRAKRLLSQEKVGEARGANSRRL
jgi:hypothetical protein